MNKTIKIDRTALNNNIIWHREEIKRISNVTLRGNFTNPEDKKYWEKRLNELNGKLLAMEQMN